MKISGAKMAMEQEREWADAQKITVSIDLVKATKTHLKFLAAVDRNRFLYEDHALQRAIYRYNAYWLPLLAKHSENPVFDGPLVAPLDCEWVWHCHRLNPVRYRFDCAKLYGRILGNGKVLSSVQGTSKTTTEDIWNKMYPEEPYELDLNRPFSEDALQNSPLTEKFTSYDLLSAVKRQIPFIYQISRSYMSDDLFLQEAAARYKGFLYLIRTNRKTNPEHSTVPTYDVDLMWHTHQLYPVSYGKDMHELVGFLVQHDDTDPDKTKEGNLYKGFSETSKQWEQTFGFSYWKAGAMNRGSVPTPVTKVPFEGYLENKEFKAFEYCGPQIHFATTKFVEVMLEFADIKNLPEEYKENLLIGFSKNQPDKLFNTRASLGISSNSEEKQVAVFQCEPKGEFVFQLMSYSTTSNELKPKNSPKLFGSCSLSLEELLSAAQPQLSRSSWVEVDLVSDLGNTEPVLLHVFMSFTPPSLAPQVFQLGRSQPSENDKIETLVMDTYGTKVFSLQKRNTVKQGTKCTLDSLEEVYCITTSGEKQALVEFDGDFWSIKGTHGSFKLQNGSGNDESLFELVGYHKMVKFFHGRRLEFELEDFKNEEPDQDFMTAVEFSAEYPYGRAIALTDLKSGAIKAIDDWIVLPGITLAFMLSGFPTECDKNEKTNDGNIVDMAKTANGSQCVGCQGRCSQSCYARVTEDTVKTANGSQCVGCQGRCSQSCYASVTEDTVKTANGGVCGVPPCAPCNIALAQMLKNDGLGSKFDAPAVCFECHFGPAQMVKNDGLGSKFDAPAVCFECHFRLAQMVKNDGLGSKFDAPAVCFTCHFGPAQMVKNDKLGSKFDATPVCFTCSFTPAQMVKNDGLGSKFDAPPVCFTCSFTPA